MIGRWMRSKKVLERVSNVPYLLLIIGVFIHMRDQAILWVVVCHTELTRFFGTAEAVSFRAATAFTAQHGVVPYMQGRQHSTPRAQIG